MNPPSDFAAHGLNALRLLGQNASAGRSTWLALDQSGGRVVVKRFSFGSPGASWEAFREHEREIAVLRELDHPAIPKFVDAFHSDDGFSLVQQYIDARPLSARQTFAPGEVETIAKALLDVLIYLQARTPSVVHRDLKPDNILLAQDGRIFLVDFGLARSLHDSNSTIAVGTPGFMPPEQMLGHALGPGADLYALGATLIACLTGARGHGVRDLVDSTFRFDLERLPVAVEPRFKTWLGRMVEPDLRRRFSDAKTALAALEAEPGPRPAANAERRTEALKHHLRNTPSQTGKPRIALVAGMVMVVAAGALGFLALRAPEVPMETAAPVSAHAEPLKSEAAATLEPERPGFPRNCSTTMLLDNRDIHIDPSKLPLTAYRGCDLTLRGLQLEAPSTLISVKNGAVVRLEDASIAVARGPAISVSDQGSTLTLRGATLRATEGAALEIERDATATITGSTIMAPVAIRTTRKAQVTVEGGDIQGEIVEDGGFVFGLDAAKDEAARRQIRADAYGRGGCSGVANCLSKSGYRGRVDLDVYARTSDGTIDAVRIAARPGVEVSKDAATCIEREVKSRPIEGWDGSELGYRYCEMSGEIHGGTQMLSNAVGFVFAADKPETATKLEALFE